jgi:hypothetical protein
MMKPECVHTGCVEGYGAMPAGTSGHIWPIETP